MIYSVRDRYTDFIVQLIGQVRERLPKKLKILFMINYLSALIALSQSKPHITPLVVHNISSIHSSQVELIPTVKQPEHCLSDAIVFWSAVPFLTNAGNKPSFRNIYQLALSLFQ